MIIKLNLHVIGSSGLSIFASTNGLASVSVYEHALSFLATFFERSEFLRILKFEGQFLITVEFEGAVSYKRFLIKKN